MKCEKRRRRHAKSRAPATECHAARRSRWRWTVAKRCASHSLRRRRRWATLLSRRNSSRPFRFVRVWSCIVQQSEILKPKGLVLFSVFLLLSWWKPYIAWKHSQNPIYIQWWNVIFVLSFAVTTVICVKNTTGSLVSLFQLHPFSFGKYCKSSRLRLQMQTQKLTNLFIWSGEIRASRPFLTFKLAHYYKLVKII